MLKTGREDDDGREYACVRPAAKNRLLSSAKHVVELERATHW